MAKFCSNCGKRLKEGAMFCSGCGKKLTVTSANSSTITSDTLLAGAGAITGTAIVTTQETANAQTANITNATASPPSNEISGELLENFFGLAADNLKDITGSIDVTNIVANVASSFGVTNVAEYIDGDTATDLIDSASEVAAGAATETVADGVTEAVGMILDFFG